MASGCLADSQRSLMSYASRCQSTLAFGTYRWPTRWHIRWQGSEGLAEASVTPSTRKPLGNWVLAGFSMGIVSGKLSYDGQQIPLYGLAELFMM